ncbi:unnamed protein product [Ceutorhynchus assimilis]|uniref:Uncharacterized protein n=1 Tax=Ceutorhynchus assimilis TaxID=467358 RepID=A0A9N9QFM6_9CUCU|nr:unnamed protein product [Ceutorhynchus assimilis]
MAGESDGDSETSVKDANLGGFKCCSKKSCSVCVCINCFSIYHNSCVKRLGKIKTKIDDTKIECCQRQDSNLKKHDELHKMEVSKMTMEIQYLKRMLDELADKSNVLKQNNALLLEKIDNLKVNPQVNKPSYSSILEPKSQSAANSKPQTTKGQLPNHEKSNKIDFPKGTNQNYQTMVKGHKNKLQQIINLESDMNTTANALNNLRRETQFSLDEEKSDDGFKVVQRRPQKKRLGTRNVGTGQEADSFMGGDRRAWIYLYRIKRHVTSQQIEDYVTKQPGFENLKISVKELPSDPTRLKSFVLTAPLNHKDKLYEPDFWPQNVGIRRFNHSLFLKYKPGGDFLA